MTGEVKTRVVVRTTFYVEGSFGSASGLRIERALDPRCGEDDGGGVRDDGTTIAGAQGGRSLLRLVKWRRKFEVGPTLCHSSWRYYQWIDILPDRLYWMTKLEGE